MAGFFSRVRVPSGRDILIGVLLLGALARAAVLPLELIHHPDELWQYLEPAYRLVFDRWVVAWEYRAGIRTWLIPTALAAPMALGNWIAPHTEFYLMLPRIMLALLSLLIVGFAAALGLRLSRLHGLIAGFVAAVWVELVHFAPRAMSEPVSLALFLPAAYLLTAPRDRITPPRAAVAGLLLGLCFAARFQLAPALGLLAIYGCRLEIKRAWIPLILGALAGLAVDAAADVAAGQTPFLWVIENFRINLIENKSAHYGVAPLTGYLTFIRLLWEAAALPILLLALIGARRYPILLAVALVNIGAHSLIPHKEYRFILLSTALLVILAAIGTADMLRWLARGRSTRALHVRAAIACAAWLAVSVSIAASEPFKSLWSAHRPLLLSLRTAGAQPGACGFALYRLNAPLLAAYTYYHRNTPIYAFPAPGGAAEAAKVRDSYNVVMSYQTRAAELSPHYTLRGCSAKLGTGDLRYCIYTRPGICSGGDPSVQINNVLRATGK